MNQNEASIAIEGETLNLAHIGQKVLYLPPSANGNPKHKNVETGTILSWSNRGVMVDYGKYFCTTRQEALVWV